MTELTVTELKLQSSTAHRRRCSCLRQAAGLIRPGPTVTTPQRRRGPRTPPTVRHGPTRSRLRPESPRGPPAGRGSMILIPSAAQPGAHLPLEFRKNPLSNAAEPGPAGPEVDRHRHRPLSARRYSTLQDSEFKLPVQWPDGRSIMIMLLPISERSIRSSDSGACRRSSAAGAAQTQGSH